MRILLLVLAVAAVALLALPTSPVSPVAPAKAFATEMAPVGDIEPINRYCQRYCKGSPGSQYCSSSPGGNNGCHHISTLGNCVFTLCIKPPPPEVQD